MSGLRAEISCASPSLQARIECDDKETLVLLGPNGAGKTSLLHAIAGLVPAARTAIELDGDQIGTLPPSARNLGVVFQDLLLFAAMSVEQNVAFGLRARGIGRRQARERVLDLLDRVGIASLARRMPGTLSGGEAQVVALARALVVDPRALLLDEPLASLDLSSREHVRTVLKDVLRSFAGPCVLVTHDVVDAMTLATTVAVIEEGRITQSATPDELRAWPKSRYAAEVAGVNVFAGSVARIESGTAWIDTGDGTIAVASDLLILGEQVVVTLSPADVSLFTDEPIGGPQNVLRGPVRSVTKLGDRVRIRVASTPPLIAEITSVTEARLGFREGDGVWATFKALEARTRRASSG